MMSPITPVRMILIGFVLLMIGVVLPFAMVLQALESTLFLNFIAYLSSIMGLVLGLLGLILRVGVERRHDE